MTRQVVEIGAILPENDLVSRSLCVDTEEVRDPAFVADLASSCCPGDAYYVSLLKEVDVANAVVASASTASVVVPGKGVHRERRHCSADDDAKCDKSSHGV